MNQTTQNDMQMKSGIRGARCFDIRAAFAASFRNWRKSKESCAEDTAFNIGGRYNSL